MKISLEKLLSEKCPETALQPKSRLRKVSTREAYSVIRACDNSSGDFYSEVEEKNSQPVFMFDLKFELRIKLKNEIEIYFKSDLKVRLTY